MLVEQAGKERMEEQWWMVALEGQQAEQIKGGR